jgi:hypothetical protein
MIGRMYNIIISTTFLLNASLPVSSQSRSNIVLIFPDHVGNGEVNAYGRARRVLTPIIESNGNS